MCRTPLHTIWPERSQHGYVNIVFARCDNGLSIKPTGIPMWLFWLSRLTILTSRHNPNCRKLVKGEGGNKANLPNYISHYILEYTVFCPGLKKHGTIIVECK